MMSLQSDLYIRYQQTIDAFIDGKNQKNIILCGSFAKKQLHEKSDIDIFIINHRKTELSEQMVYVEGIKVDVLECSYEGVLRILEEEKNSFLRRISSFLSSGILLQHNVKTQDIIDIAKNVFSFPVPNIDREKLWAMSKKVSRSEELLREYMEMRSDISFFLRSSMVVQNMISFYFELHKKPYPNYKNTGEGIIDKELEGNIRQFYISSTVEEKFTYIERILHQIKGYIKNY